ncbi:hypothetical protein [Pinirhizobacter soli]|uniref:hypothetical protein n=1 Tax=Pinirhizobacter soli TaxID=2786953 RepID=UPI00202AB24D|nr:hypothetical protein [Pinirhizobacter soli]
MDVFRALEIVDARRGEVTALALGDALGIFAAFSEENELSQAARLLLTTEFIWADGDIFLNAIAAEFQADEFRDRLGRLLESKWTTLESLLLSDNLRKSIYGAVTIETQPTNKGSQSKFGEIDLNRLLVKRLPLRSSLDRPTVAISDSYLRKALPRRKAWAISLGISNDDGTITDDGKALLEGMVSLNQCGPSTFTVWPLVHELQSALFTSMRARGFPSVTFFDLLSATTSALVKTGTSNTLGVDELAREIQHIHCDYQKLNTAKRIVRSELPLRVLERCLVKFAIRGQGLPSVRDSIEELQAAHPYGIRVRASRVAEYAFSFGGK